MLVKFDELLAGNLKEGQPVWVCKHNVLTDTKSFPLVECVFLGFDYIRDKFDNTIPQPFSVREKISGNILCVTELFDDESSACLHLRCIAETQIKELSIEIAKMEKEVQEKNRLISYRKSSIADIKKSISRMK